jgi:CHAT domain-containing protein
MPLSVAQENDIECPACGSKVAAQAWIVIDFEERPEIWARFRNGTLNLLTCGNQHQIELKAPVLLHDRVRKRIFFYMVHTHSVEENERIQRLLLKHLEAALHAHARGEDYPIAQYVSVPVTPVVLTEGSDSSDAVPRGELLRREEYKGVIGEIYERSGEDISLRAELCKEAINSLNREEDPILWAVLHQLLGNSLFHSPAGNHFENIELAIQAYESSLTILTRESWPTYWAMAHADLGAAYGERQEGEPADNVEKSIQALRSALDVYTPTKESGTWADLNVRLGDQYRRRTRGEYSENIKNAISCFEAATGVYTLDSLPESWAIIETKIGVAYARRKDGDRAENLDLAIKAFESTLQFYNLEEFPEQWAYAQNYLADLYSQRINGEVDENVKCAVEACEAALSVYTPEAFPADWASTQAILGLALIKQEQLPIRDKEQSSEVIERAIRALDAALTFYSAEDFPEEWVGAMANLGTAYRERILGDRTSNIERAIQLYETAQTAIDKNQFPENWAALQFNLAEAYEKRVLGDRDENIDDAITAYESAATESAATKLTAPYQDIFTRAQGSLLVLYARHESDRANQAERAIEIFESLLRSESFRESSERWADIQLSLGVTYSERALGNHAENIEQAIKACQAALSVFKSDTSLKNWAHAKTLLANLYRTRQTGERAENIEQAVRVYEEILVALPKSSRKAWAEVQLGLAISYIERIRGSRADNIELAVKACEAASSMLIRDKPKKIWVRAQIELGLAYYSRIRGSREENLETAIRVFESALSVLTQEKSPSAWAIIQNNLGNAYSDRILGSRADNLEKAIKAFEAALKIYSRTIDPEHWAGSQINLGTIYIHRVRGERADNTERAIRAFKAALTVFTPQSYPYEWARAQLNLSMAYIRRVAGNEKENVDEAIRIMEATLNTIPGLIIPYDRAGMLLNLAGAYLRRCSLRGNGWQDQERALEACEGALSLFTREESPELWASLQGQLSNIYFARRTGDRAENLEHSLQLVEAALEVFTREAFPGKWASIQTMLGNTYSKRILGDREENVERAVGAYRAALEIHSPAESPAEARTLALRLGEALGRQQDWCGAHSAFLVALECAEQLYTNTVSHEGKSAELADNIHIYKFLVQSCLRLDPPRNLEAFQYAEESRARLLRDQLGGLDFPPPPGVPSKLIEREQALLKALRGLNIAALSHSDERMRQIWVEEAERVLTELNSLWDTLVNEYGAADYVGLRRGARIRWEELQAWLQRQGRQVAIIEFFTLTDELIVFIARIGEDGPRVIEIRLSSLKILDFAQRLQREMWHLDPDEPCKETWRGLAPILLPELMPNLDGVELVYIVADNALHYLPLHALEYKGEPLVSYFPIAYIPSVAAALRIHHQSSAPPRLEEALPEGRFLVVGNPTGDLPFAEEEAKKVAQLLNVRPLLRGEATLRRVMSRMASKSAAHFATHAYYHSPNAFASGVILANDRILTAGDVMAEAFRVQLLVLSGCETGRQAVGAGNELFGLANAFLYAGVSSLILSQWAVSDNATAVLMDRLYRQLYDAEGEKKLSVAEALRAAMMEVRAEYPSTYYWAPFFLFGEWS